MRFEAEEMNLGMRWKRKRKSFKGHRNRRRWKLQVTSLHKFITVKHQTTSGEDNNNDVGEGEGTNSIQHGRCTKIE